MRTISLQQVYDQKKRQLSARKLEAPQPLLQTQALSSPQTLANQGLSLSLGRHGVSLKSKPLTGEFRTTALQTRGQGLGT
jgi:hypothetical protein